jgi:hypothetical protein
LPRKKKLSLKQAAERLTAITERYLRTLPEEEREFGVATFERSVAALQREKHRREYDLGELLKGVCRRNMHREVDFGGPPCKS